jgi:hypothetical protein
MSAGCWRTASGGNLVRLSSACPVVFDVKLTLSFVSSCFGINDGYFQFEIGTTTSVVFNRVDESMSLEAIQVPPTSPP